MSRLLDEQTVIDALTGWETEPTDEEIEWTIKQLPSAEPRWIPCSKKLPEADDKVLCCTVTKKNAKNIVIGYYFDGRWACGMNSNVIAWMPLPEPYKEADNERD